MTNEANKNKSILKIKGYRMVLFIDNYFIIFFAVRFIVCHFYKRIRYLFNYNWFIKIIKYISFLFMTLTWRLAASFIRFISAIFVKFTLNFTKYIFIVRL